MPRDPSPATDTIDVELNSRFQSVKNRHIHVVDTPLSYGDWMPVAAYKLHLFRLADRIIFRFPEPEQNLFSLRTWRYLFTYPRLIPIPHLEANESPRDPSIVHD